MKATVALRFFFFLGGSFLAASPRLHAIPYYWDNDGTTAGFGTAAGTWAAPTTGDITQGWSTSSTGVLLPGDITTGTSDGVNFGTALDSLAAGTVSVSGAVSVNGITFGSASGAITLSGGTSITLGGTTPTITVNNTQNTISATILQAGTGNNTGLNKAGTGELILSGTGNSIAGDAAPGNGVGIRVSAGTLTVSGGSLATATAGKGIGTFSGDVGNFKQTGGTVAVNATGDLVAGWNTNSTFTLSGGTTSATNIRHQDAGDGVVTISGTNTTTVGTVYNNTNSTGTDSLTVNLNTGGTLAANSLSMSLGANAQASGNHSLNVNFDGGMLKARSTANLIAATPTGGASTRAINVLVKTNGALFDSNGFTATVLQPILHDSGGPAIDGGLTLNDTAVTKGTLVLTGANTYTGATTITAGTLQFAKQTSLYNNATASWTAANIKVAATGTLALNVGGTGEFTTGNVTTLLTNLGGANGTSTTGFAAGSFIGFNTANAVPTTFTVADILADSTGSGGGAIGVRKLGANTLVLSGPNTYTGATTVSGGFLVLNHLNAIANSASVSVASGTTLQPNLAGTYANTTAVSLTGAGINTGPTNFAGALFFGNGANAAAVWNAPITLGGAANNRITSFGVTMDQTLGGAIGGTGPLELSSRGGLSSIHRATWTLNAASNYTGNTTIVNNDGLQDVTVKLGVANALPTTTSVNLSAIQGSAAPSAVFATLDLNGFSQTLAGLTDTGGNITTAPGTGNKRVINSSGTLATLTINNAGAVTYGTTGTNITAGTIGGTTAGGAAANNIALTKTAAGTLTLNAANTYTGATTVSAGTLALGVNGSIANSASVSLAAGATLDTSLKASYTIPVSTVNFGIDAADSGSSGKITAALLNVTNATVTYNITGTPDDPAYVLATYTGVLTGPFAGVPTPPSGYTLDYAFEGNKIALVQTGGNAAPGISNLTDLSVPSGGNTGPLAFTVADEDPASVTPSGTSSNLTLVPNANILFGGSGANRTVTVTPVSGLTGSATITVTLTDNGSLTVQDTFVLTVTNNYLSWATANSVTGGETGDSDNDGVKNLVEYALIDGGERGDYTGNTITFSKRLAPYGTDVSYAIETSIDLGSGDNWESAVSGVTENASAISYTFNPGTPARNFARLKVTRP